jgi:hypothetical protein
VDRVPLLAQSASRELLRVLVIVEALVCWAPPETLASQAGGFSKSAHSWSVAARLRGCIDGVGEPGSRAVDLCRLAGHGRPALRGQLGDQQDGAERDQSEARELLGGLAHSLPEATSYP